MENKFIQIIKNKWLRSVVLTILLVAILVCVYFVINYAVEKANFGDIDMTKEKIYSISQETKDKLGNMENDITLYIYKMSDYVKDFAHKYAKLNNHIKVEELENLNAKTNWKTEYGITEETPFIVISTMSREKILYDTDLYTYNYTTYQQMDITEEAITNGILDVITVVKPKIYFLSGHNLHADTYFQYFKGALADEVNDVQDLNLMTSGKVPDDCDVLVITALKEDIKELEKDELIKYIKKGGKILLLLDPNLNNTKLSNFEKVLDEYGVSVSNGLLIEGDPNQMVSGMPNFIISKINKEAGIIKNINMDINLCLINAGKLNILSQEELDKRKVTSEILATTSEKAFHRTDLQSSSQSKIDSDQDAGNSVIAAIMTKNIDDNTKSKLIAFSNTTFATNAQIQVSSQYFMYPMDFSNNKDILLNSISYLTEREDNITIRKNMETVNYDVNEFQNRIILSIIFAVPAVIIFVGILVWILRRKKK